MLKKLLPVLGMFAASLCFALVPVDANKADQAALDGVKGIGPTTSKAILDERKRAGPFKDWADFSGRVKGIGDKKSVSLSKAGLTINGQSKANAAAISLPKTAVQQLNAKPENKHAKAETRK